VIGDEIIGVAGHVNHLHLRSELQQARRHLAAGGAGQDHVGQQQIDRRIETAGKFDAGLAVVRFQHDVAVGAQSVGDHPAQRILVLHEQDGLGTPGGQFQVLARSVGVDRARHDRKIHLEARALADFAVDGDAALALLHDAVHGGQTEARALARLFGGEKRLEYALLDGRRHARPRVAHGQQHVFPRRDRRTRLAFRRADLDIRGLDVEFAAARHGVRGVDGEIEHDLLDLAAIREDGRAGGDADHVQIDVRADHPAQQFFQVVDHRTQVEQHRTQQLLAAEGEQLTRERCRALTRGDDLLIVLGSDLIAGEVFVEQFAIRENDLQGVVEIVRHTAGQASHGFHFLRLQELRLEIAPHGDVEKRHHRAQNVRSLDDGVGPIFHRELRVVRAKEHLIVHVRALPGAKGLMDLALIDREGSAVVAAVMMPVMHVLPDELPHVRVTQQARGGGVAERAQAIDVQATDSLRGRIEQQQVLRFAVDQLLLDAADVGDFDVHDHGAGRTRALQRRHRHAEPARLRRGIA